MGHMKKILSFLLVFIVFFPLISQAKTYQVKKIIDGDTIELKNGTTIRLIGIDAPELSSDECYSQKAKNKLEDFILNKRIKLKYDEERTDSFGRTLAFVYRGTKFINKKMLSSGSGKYLMIGPNLKNKDILLSAEKIARTNNRGLWNKCEDPDNLLFDCSDNLYNCSDFDSQGKAQEMFDYCMDIVGEDVHDLDRDGNGLACESI
jgi:endonuclease YncB( thermonuclease family)